MELDERILTVSQMSDEEIATTVADMSIGLTPFEVRRVAELIGRDPTFCELHIFNVEWSEHCSYKSSRATLKEFLPTDGPNVILGPQEDAGIVFFTEFEGKRYGVVIAHESHNHPSQVLPNEGAATGVGGIVRDVDCMGARVIATGDPLRFGDPTGAHAERTKWIVRGVVDGIWQYGNALGVPNLAGDIYFHESFDDNCLVNVVALGLVAEEDIIHSAVPCEAFDQPYDMILVGKPTDDSGYGGSAFASKIIGSEEEKRDDRGAVQVPDPFLKNVLAMRKANEAVRTRAKELGLKIGVKDIGGGGFACGSSEITDAGGMGVEINLDEVHVGLDNLLPEVISCAETQERYVLAVPAGFTAEVLRIYNEDWDLPNVYENAQARVVGRYIPEQVYRLTHQGKIVCEAPVKAVTTGIRYDRVETPREFTGEEPQFYQPADLGEVLLSVLGSMNICSRGYIFRDYDSEVQGNAVIRPGEAGAGVMAPLEGSDAAIALSVDANPFYGLIDPYWGGATAVAEAMRNVACVGATPAGLTDCLCYGNPELPESFWEFRQGVRGISDAARNLPLKDYSGAPTPVVSGNVSLYNESAGGSVAPSPIIACVGVMPDYTKALTMQLKRPGASLFLLGPRKDELGGSAYYQVLNLGLGRNVPQVDWELESNMIFAVIDAIQAGHVAAAQDISDGGLLVAVSEMALGGHGKGRHGATLDVTASDLVLPGTETFLRPDKWLFSESSGFVVECTPGHEAALLDLCARYNLQPLRLGEVSAEPTLEVKIDGQAQLQVSLDAMRDAWVNGLAKVLR
ncbi:MAG TPA: phosphoribosylformylglycinamidine synthase subunit PurL [Armatimonadota bacterium]|jgi:phosphoribosylformylglycinamidine synthase